MHPAEISTYLAEKRAGVYDNGETLTDSATATVALTIIAYNFTAALATLKDAYGNAAEHWEDCDESAPGPHIFTPITYTFHIAAPENLDGMTEDQARDYLKDTYPDMPADQWEIEQ